MQAENQSRTRRPLPSRLQVWWDSVSYKRVAVKKNIAHTGLRTYPAWSFSSSVHVETLCFVMLLHMSIVSELEFLGPTVICFFVYKSWTMVSMILRQFERRQLAWPSKVAYKSDDHEIIPIIQSLWRSRFSQNCLHIPFNGRCWPMAAM